MLSEVFFVGFNTEFGIIREIEELVELIRVRALDWWWLDQGNYPVVRVGIFREVNGGISSFQSPKLSLNVALSKLRDNMLLAGSLDFNGKFEVLSSVLNDLQVIHVVLERILNIHRMLEDKLRLLNKLTKIPDARDALEIFNLTLNNVKMMLNAGNSDWERVLNDFKKALNYAEKVLSSIPISKIEKEEHREKVVGEEKEEKLIEEV